MEDAPCLKKTRTQRNGVDVEESMIHESSSKYIDSPSVASDRGGLADRIVQQVHSKQHKKPQRGRVRMKLSKSPPNWDEAEPTACARDRASTGKSTRRNTSAAFNRTNHDRHKNHDNISTLILPPSSKRQRTSSEVEEPPVIDLTGDDNDSDEKTNSCMRRKTSDESASSFVKHKKKLSGNRELRNWKRTISNKELHSLNVQRESRKPSRCHFPDIVEIYIGGFHVENLKPEDNFTIRAVDNWMMIHLQDGESLSFSLSDLSCLKMHTQSEPYCILMSLKPNGQSVQDFQRISKNKFIPLIPKKDFDLIDCKKSHFCLLTTKSWKTNAISSFRGMIRKFASDPVQAEEEDIGIINSIWDCTHETPAVSTRSKKLSETAGTISPVRAPRKKPGKTEEELAHVVAIWPPSQKPGTKGVFKITVGDRDRLDEGEFLNDVLINFYLKYLEQEVFSDSLRDKVHIFNTFFYKRFTVFAQKCRDPNKGFEQAKKWIKHVDVFDKDFLVVPINEAAHWYLAIVCFAGMDPAEVQETFMCNLCEGCFDDRSKYESHWLKVHGENTRTPVTVQKQLRKEDIVQSAGMERNNRANTATCSSFDIAIVSDDGQEELPNICSSEPKRKNTKVSSAAVAAAKKDSDALQSKESNAAGARAQTEFDDVLISKEINATAFATRAAKREFDALLNKECNAAGATTHALKTEFDDVMISKECNAAAYTTRAAKKEFDALLSYDWDEHVDFKAGATVQPTISGKPLKSGEAADLDSSENVALAQIRNLSIDHENVEECKEEFGQEGGGGNVVVDDGEESGPNDDDVQLQYDGPTTRSTKRSKITKNSQRIFKNQQRIPAPLTLCSKRPCVLLFDSLGSKRMKPGKELKTFLTCAWLDRHKSASEDDRNRLEKRFEHMPTYIVKATRQDNHCDCGVFVLHYVESFFGGGKCSASVIQQWCQEGARLETCDVKVVKNKRAEIRGLIDRIGIGGTSVSPELGCDTKD